MLWSKRKAGEPSRADLTPGSYSGCRASDTDRALDTLGTLLKTYGRFAFDTEQAAEAIREQCDAWARRIVLGETRRQNGAEDDAGALVRDWPGLQRFFDDQRKHESDFVTRNLSRMRQSVLALARCLGASVGEDQESDARVERGLMALSRALVDGDVERITQAATSVIDTARESMEQRREREARQVVSLGQELRLLREELSEHCKAAASDELTGLFGRRAFEQQLEQLSCIGGLLEHRPWLIVMDVDALHNEPARQGEGWQDEVLQEVSKSISRTFLRKPDFLARCGGNQFAALLVDITEEQTVAACQRLLEGVRKLAVGPSRRKQGAACTLSVGIAQLRANETAARWAARANVALARAQEDGGDGYELSPG